MQNRQQVKQANKQLSSPMTSHKPVQTALEEGYLSAAQKAKYTPGTLSASDISLLQGAIGNGAAEKVLQRRVLASDHDITRRQAKSIWPKSIPERQQTKGVQTKKLANAWPQLTNNDSTSGMIQRDWLSDIFDLRENEEAWDEWEDYQDAKEELATFRSKTYPENNFQSTTGRGMFDALYIPAKNTLQIVVKCKFDFVKGEISDFPDARPEELEWTDQGEMDGWKQKYLSTVSSKWTGNHTFYCQKDWWESLGATITVTFSEVTEDEHFALSIAKIPTGERRKSSTSKPKPGIFGYTPGTGKFDSEDLTEVSKPGGRQMGAVHEAGHMMGLGDEYKTGSSKPPAHSDMVQSEFGHSVEHGKDARIMSGGMDIQPEHGVTFLAALKAATGMDEWSVSPKSARAIPANPAALQGPGDFPTPNQNEVPV